jgi:hypothetical protein
MPLPRDSTGVVAAVKRGKRRDASLDPGDRTRKPVVGVNDVKMLLNDNSPHLASGAHVVERMMAAVKLEHAHLDPEVSEVLDLITNERSEPWLIRGRKHIRHD